MPDAIAHSPGHASAASLGDALAARLGLRSVTLSPRRPVGDVLLVAPSAERRHHDPAIPVVVLTPAAGRRAGVLGRCVICGVQDAEDAPAVAIAAALADALDLGLLLIHVVPPVGMAVPGPMAAPVVHGLTVQDRAGGRETVDRVAAAAGVGDCDPGVRRVIRGTPGPTLAAMARAEDAAVVAVSASVRPRLTRALIGSATGHLARHCERPLLVCPRDPVAAMRIREALASNAASWRFRR